MFIEMFIEMFIKISIKQISLKSLRLQHGYILTYDFVLENMA